MNGKLSLNRVLNLSIAEAKNGDLWVILNIELGKLHSFLCMLSYADSGFLPPMGCVLVIQNKGGR